MISSVSLNYYTYISKMVEVKIEGEGTNALNDEGKSIYANQTDDFGIICGD